MKEDESIESRIQQAMRSRVQHFRDQADSLTFEGVRRLLEKDLVLDTYALDVHKRYVKQLLEKYLSETEDEENVSKGSEQIKLEQDKEEEEKLKEHKVTDIRPEDEGKIEDSPVMGLLSGNESAKSGSETQANAKDNIPTVDLIKEALWKKATYFKSKSEELTVAGVRRLLEDDLELKKYSLDSFKKLISKQLDEVLNSQNDTPDKTDSRSDADSSHSESLDIEVKVKPKKKLAPKGKVQISEKPKKRKRPAKETERARKKQTKHAEETSNEKNNVQDVDDESNAEKSESSAEKSVKKDMVAPVYGKKVERLKSIIKSCGMSVAPTVYKKAKQVPEDKREAFLVKELQEVLSREGLSTKPTEKEIKEVKRRKERAKELEGIDTSNIVLGSRRRSTSTFIPPPKPKEPIEPGADDSEDSDNDDDDDSEDSDNDDGDDSEDNNKDDGDDQDEGDNVHANQSEEIREDAGDSD
ncbi:glutamic acid-rich protein-like [Cynara cardunculus var. scolymus]|uniref:glutamic acid-rich protein-like n=1 Tax=Cynara cardunculus var. scolymus TaxID=59895 RepID=UPI000D6310B4|nr:glutamic acid-rich protein-like [Cynara cardunculus var. scolymus]